MLFEHLSRNLVEWLLKCGVVLEIISALEIVEFGPMIDYIPVWK